MALNKRQASMLNDLLSRGLLQQPKLGGLKVPKGPNFKPLPMPTQAPIKNRQSDYATYLLTNALNDKSVGKAMGRALASGKSAEDEEQSMLSQLFDTMMIPNYTVANIAESVGKNLDDPWEMIKGVGKDVLDAGTSVSTEIFGRGLTKLPFIGDDIERRFDETPFKQEKRTFSDNLQDMGMGDNPITHGLGLAMDIGLDPLTYVGGLGIGARIAKGKRAIPRNPREILDAKAAVPESILKPGIKRSIDAGGKPKLKLPEPPKAPPVAEMALRGDSIPRPPRIPELPKQDLSRFIPDPALGIPRTRKLGRRRTRPPEYTYPTRSPIQKMARQQADWEKSMTKLGKVSEGGRINMSGANKVVQEIASGNVPKVLPKPTVATGERAVAAKAMAEDVLKRVHPGKLPAEYNAGMQIALFKKVASLLDSKTATVDEGIGLLRAAEDHLISLGVHPVRNEGVRVRLSDVMNLLKDRVPVDVVLNNFARKDVRKMDPLVREAIQTVAAYRSMAISDILDNVTSYAQRAKAVSEQYVGRQKVAAEAQIIDEAMEVAASAGTTKSELDAVKNLIKDVVNIDKIPADKFYSQASEQLLKAFDDGRVSADLVARFNRAVASSYGYGYKPAQLSERVTGNRVVDLIMGNFFTQWGKGSFFQKGRGFFDAGQLNAQARAEALRNLASKYSKEEIKNAWRLVNRQADAAALSPREVEVAGYFRNYFDEVLRVPEHAMSLVNAQTKHLSVAERNMMLMDDVNRHLKDMGNSFQFTNKKIVTDQFGVKRNFGDAGEGWQSSWALWDPDDPLKFLYDIDLALERTTKEYAFLDNFVDVFGSLGKTKDHTYQIKNAPRIADFWVPEDVGRQMQRVMNDVHKGQWRPRTGLTRFYTQGLKIWKTSVTIYFPSHHIRNGIGDMYLMWMAGHNHPLAFKYAARIMHSQKGRYQAAIKSGDFGTLREFTDPAAIKMAQTRGKDIILNVNGTRVSADELYVNAFQRGLLKNANQLEDIFGESRIGIKPLGGTVHGAATGAAEYREHFIRLAHFTSAVNKKLKKGQKNLQSIFDEAAEEVRKWHPDGTDLTYFEQKYMRNIIPFYSWIRKSTPLLVESLVTRPAKTLMYPRGMVALQNSLGIDTTMADPFPDDQLFPEWLRETGIGPIGDPESSNPISAWWGNLGRNAINQEGKPYGYTFVQPGNPLIDQGRQFMGFGPKDTLKGLYESITPFVKVPTDLARDEEFTGAPIYKDSGGRGVGQYLMKQFGATSPIQRYFDIGEKDREGVEKQPVDWPAIINNLTAAGVYGSGPYIKSAEFEAKRLAKIKAEEQKK